MANDNVELGRFDLVGIPSAYRGIPKIEVTFDIDSNGIVHVHAKDLGTDKEQSIRITAPQKLSEKDIDKMVKEAQNYAEEDNKMKEVAELRNRADNLVYSTEKTLKDYGDKILESDKKGIEEKAAELKEILKKGDVSKEEIEKTMDDLMKASHKLAEEVYKAQASQQQDAKPGVQPEAEEEEPKKANEGEVIDAEYKDENKK